VEDFEQRYAAFRGLNLTFEVREGIIKHSREYDPREFPELREYLPELRPPLEAQLVDLTDEIAYSVADLDDGYEARILTAEQICNEVSLFAECYREASARFPGAQPKLLFNEALKRMVDRMVTDLIEHTAEAVRQAGVDSVEQVRTFPSRLVVFGQEMEDQRRQVKEFLYAKLYFSSELVPEKEAAERIITDLFEFWMNHPVALPESYQEKFREDSLPRIICDYMAGMTDNYILDQYKRLLKEAPGH
jgi:dGTPase